MSGIPDNKISERIGRLETSVEGLHSEFSDIRATLRAIQESMGRSRETNWSVVLAGVAVAGSLYAAAIRPLASDIARQERQAEILARTLAIQNEMQFANKNEAVKRGAELDALRIEFNNIRDLGSPITDKRLAILELQAKVKP